MSGDESVASGDLDAVGSLSLSDVLHAVAGSEPTSDGAVESAVSSSEAESEGSVLAVDHPSPGIHVDVPVESEAVPVSRSSLVEAMWVQMGILASRLGLPETGYPTMEEAIACYRQIGHQVNAGDVLEEIFGGFDGAGDLSLRLGLRSWSQCSEEDRHRLAGLAALCHAGRNIEKLMESAG